MTESLKAARERASARIANALAKRPWEFGGPLPHKVAEPEIRELQRQAMEAMAVNMAKAIARQPSLTIDALLDGPPSADGK